jgi:hypothetical protein
MVKENCKTTLRRILNSLYQKEILSIKDLRDENKFPIYFKDDIEEKVWVVASPELVYRFYHRDEEGILTFEFDDIWGTNLYNYFLKLGDIRFCISTYGPLELEELEGVLDRNQSKMLDYCTTDIDLTQEKFAKIS